MRTHARQRPIDMHISVSHARRMHVHMRMPCMRCRETRRRAFLDIVVPVYLEFLLTSAQIATHLAIFVTGGFSTSKKFEPGGFSARSPLVARRMASTYGRYASLGPV